MKELRYLSGVTTLKLDADACTGCGACATVCPHRVFELEGTKPRKARIADLDACMECGACSRNCPEDAIGLNPGTGCASYILQTWLKGKARASCCG